MSSRTISGIWICDQKNFKDRRDHKSIENFQTSGRKGIEITKKCREILVVWRDERIIYLIPFQKKQPKRLLDDMKN